MPDHVVTFQEGGQQSTETIPEGEFTEGPPEVDVSGRIPFTQRGLVEQTESWRRWLEAGNDVRLLDDAREAVREAQQRFPVQLPGGVYEMVELPHAIVYVTVQKVAYGVVGGPPAPPPQTVEHELDRRNFDVGPPDLASGFDPGFRALDDATKSQRWQTYLAGHDLLPNLNSMRAQRYFLDAVAARRADVNRCLDCLCAPSTKWSLVLLGLLAAGGGAYGLYELFRPGSPVYAPVGVSATVTTGLVGGTRVTVTWAAPAIGPAPTSYAVTLQPTAGGDQRGTDADGPATSAVFDGVADGTYTVTVTAFQGMVMGAAGTTTVTVSATAPPPPTPTAAPDPPTDVTLTVGLSAVSGRRGLTAAWTPPATGATPTGYTVALDGVTPPVVDVPVAVGLMTSWPFLEPDAGTYRASVTASNAAGTSALATSSVVTYSAVPAASPDAPQKLTTHVFLSRMPGGKAALTLTWDRPTTGTEVRGFDVTISGTGQPTFPLHRTGPATSTTVDPLDDGTYTVTVVTYNDAGKGAAATATVTVDHTTVDADGIDWTPVFGADQITAWKALKVPIAQMAEADFWKHVLAVLEDKADVHGGLASYPTMLFIARLLTLWIDVPSTDPRDSQIDDWADDIAQACSPRFPKTKPSTEYLTRLAPWQAAMDLKNPITKRPVVLRYKLFGLVGALERYLGVRT